MYRATFNLLTGQIGILEQDIKKALEEYDANGTNGKPLTESFFIVCEAIERVLQAQAMLNGGKQTTDLAAYIAQLKAAFKAIDAMAEGTRGTTIARAQAEADQATIH